MKLSKPDEDPNEPAEDHGEVPESRTLPTVEYDYGGESTEEKPLTDAVELNNRILFDPESFGIATQETVRDLTARVEELQEQRDDLRERVEDLERVVEIAAVESDYQVGQCPNCGTKLEENKPALSDNRVECPECAFGVKEVRNVQ